MDGETACLSIFVASPSVVILTSLDQQINKTERNLLVDSEPKLMSNMKRQSFR